MAAVHISPPPTTQNTAWKALAGSQSAIVSQHPGTAVRLLPALSGLHIEVGSTQEAISSLAKAVPNSFEHTVASHGAWGHLRGR